MPPEERRPGEPVRERSLQATPRPPLYVAICQVLPHLSSTMQRRSPYFASRGVALEGAPMVSNMTIDPPAAAGACLTHRPLLELR